MDRIKAKLERWRNSLLSMAGRVMIINKYIIPTIIYFLSCWRPPDNSIKQFNSLCRNFLWSGSTSDFKIPKVKWDICCLHKDKGGLGIINCFEMANRLASKWMVRSLITPQEDWAVLLHRNLNRAFLKDFPLWENIPQITLFFSPWPVSTKGSQLTKSIWKAWNEIKGLVKLRENREAIPFLAQDSIWWPMQRPQIEEDQMERACHLNNQGIRTWADLWDLANQEWKSPNSLVQEFDLNVEELVLILDRIDLIGQEEQWKVGVRDSLSPKGLGWNVCTPIYPIPKMETTPPVHVKLNERWGVLYDRTQWYFKFTKLWAKTIPPKKSTHMWLILHQGLWTGARALRAGIGDGMCKRCRNAQEDIHHLFMGCPHNKLVLAFLNRISRNWKGQEVSWKQLLLGDSFGCSTSLWNTIRACFLWHIWTQRNAVVFGSPQPPIADLVFTLIFQVRKHWAKTKDSLQERLEFLYVAKNQMEREVVWNSNRRTTYTTWYEEMARELSSTESDDQDLAEMIIELSFFYKTLDDEAPPRN